MIVLILAGGMGKRMQSDKPKVLIDIFGKPMIVRLIKRALLLNPTKIIIVTSKNPIIQETVESFYPDNINIEFCIQENPFGTGNAVKCCLDKIDKGDKVFILCGDIPFLSTNLMKKLVDNTDVCGLLTVELDDPKGFGRIIEKNNSLAIVEEKDCDDEQRKVNIVNTGIYCMMGNLIHEYIHQIENKNKQNEYYFTDIIGLIGKSHKIQAIRVSEDEKTQVMGVNTKEELERLIDLL